MSRISNGAPRPNKLGVGSGFTAVFIAVAVAVGIVAFIIVGRGTKTSSIDSLDELQQQWKQEDEEWHKKQSVSTPKISGSDITDADREAYGGVITILANALYRAYDANEVAADEKYKGKSVKITGKVQNIGKDILGSPY